MVIPKEVLLLLRIIFDILGFVVTNEFENCSYKVYKELSWNVDKDCIESIDCFWQDVNFYYINPANPCVWEIFLRSLISLFTNLKW